ncbi:Endoglucanase-4 [Dactylella cylindrospora]|nr:Endoglucanase-4 [Dactylella cylindrospora]
MFRIGLLIAFVASISGSYSHYVFNNLIYNDTTYPEWQYIRRPWNYDTYFPLFDLNSTQMRCFTASNYPRASILPVEAGDTVGFNVGGRIIHQGPLLFYMAQAGLGTTAATTVGSGQSWFKIWETQPEVVDNELAWPLYNLMVHAKPLLTRAKHLRLDASEVFVQIPPCLPSGDYLLRVEHIALHIAFDYGQAEFFGSCAQLRVSGSGSQVPSPKVAFPGAYKSTDPGILLDIHDDYPSDYEYIVPGPAVWTC